MARAFVRQAGIEPKPTAIQPKGRWFESTPRY